MENSGAFKQPLFLGEGSGKLFTKEELAELEMFDREVDNEDQLRGNAQKREWKKSTPEIHERVKQANREYYQRNRERICARRRERYHTYEKYKKQEGTHAERKSSL